MRKISNTDQVREYIRDYIVQNNLKSGDMLPCEGKIAEDLGIGRNSVREATRALASIGILEIKHGVGLVVREFNLDAIVDIFTYGFALDRTLIFDLYSIRKQLESSLMDKVIENINEVTISKCELILAEWDYSVQKGTPVHDIDRKFHDTLYKPVGNDLLIALCDMFWSAFKQAEQNGVIIRYTPSEKEEALKVLSEHREILQAIKEKDAEKARLRMVSHFRKLVVPEQK